MRLAYACEAESRIDRINRKSHKLEAKLTEDGEKPKWMRWRTYERICARLDDLEGAVAKQTPCGAAANDESAGGTKIARSDQELAGSATQIDAHSSN